MAESHVVSALKAKRAELAGEAGAVERQLAQLRADLVHVDAVLRMFDPAAQPDAIPARRPYRRRRWFSPGASSIPYGALRGPWAPTLLLIRKSIQSYLRRQSGTLVQPAGRNGREENRPRSTAWRVR